MSNQKSLHRPSTSSTNTRKSVSSSKYSNIQSKVYSGKTQRDVKTYSNSQLARRKGELFKRIRSQTLLQLLQFDLTNQRNAYFLSQEANDPLYSMSYTTAPTAFSAVSSQNKVPEFSQTTEFLLLDLREKSEFQAFHIIDSISYPAATISRDTFPLEIFRVRNVPGKLIVVYHSNQRRGVEAAQKFCQKGFDNIYLLSGGIIEFGSLYPQMVEGVMPSRPSTAKTIDERIKQ